MANGMVRAQEYNAKILYYGVPVLFLPSLLSVTANYRTVSFQKLIRFWHSSKHVVTLNKSSFCRTYVVKVM
jgi:hypothetical protein